MKIIRNFLLGWAIGFSVVMLFARCAHAASPPVTARLTVDEATCSGTIVAPNAILSAKHCFKDEDPTEIFPGFTILPKPLPATMLVDGYRVYIIAIVFDDADHALVKTDVTFKDFAKITKQPDVGAHVHYWGNPAGINNVYREGYVTSYVRGSMVMDVNGFFGDSGAGIFDETGRVVGVMSYIGVQQHSGMTFRLMGSYPLDFTPLQYVMMGVTPP